MQELLAAQTAFLIALNLALMTAGGAIFLKAILKKEDKPWLATLLLIGIGGLSLFILFLLGSRFSLDLFGQEIVKVSVNTILLEDPAILTDVLILALGIWAATLSSRETWATLVLAGIFVLVTAWFALGDAIPPGIAPSPVVAALTLGVVTVRFITRYSWAVLAPVALAVVMLVVIVVGSLPQNISRPLLAREESPGFDIDLYADLSGQPTALAIDPDGAIYVSTLEGVVYRLRDTDDDGRADDETVYADDLDVILGVAYHDGSLYISAHEEEPALSTGRIVRAIDEDGDGVADTLTDIVTDLPSRQHGVHQNNNVVVGPDERLYVGVGSTSDHQPETVPLAATILVSDLDGDNLEVYATGLRNAYGLAWSSDGRLFATDNSPDNTDEVLPYFPPDELNLIVEGADYGYPELFERVPPGAGVEPPLVLFTPHAAPTGLDIYEGTQFPAEYRGNLFVALWQQGRVVRVTLTERAGAQFGDFRDFITNLDQPIAVLEGLQGELFIADFRVRRLYRVTYQGN